MEMPYPSWSKDAHVVVAVSTGIDSMVLLHCLLHHWQDTYRTLTCLHVNHGLRDASTAEATFIETYCTRHDIPIYIHNLDLTETQAQGRSIQNDAREARYQWFDQMMAHVSGDVLLTAHHEDDQIETIFYRLMTGKTTRNRLGMSESEQRRTYQLVRPLLQRSKVWIRDYQQQYDVPYFEDTSNENNAYVRNDIRNRILPNIQENKQLDTTQLLKLKRWHDDAMDIIEQHAAHFLQTELIQHRDDTMPWSTSVSRSAFLQLPDAVRVCVLDRWFEQCGLHVQMSERAYQSWFAQLSSEAAQNVLYATDEWIIQFAYDKLVIMANHIARLNSVSIHQAGTYHFGSYRIQIMDTMPAHAFPIMLRSRSAGDKVSLNHMDGHKKVNRLMIDQKIEARQREVMPVVVTTHDEIIAVGTLYKNQVYYDSVVIENMGVE